MHQGIPVFFNQGRIDIGLSNCGDLWRNDRATRHIQMALLQFLQSWTQIKPQQARQRHRKVGVPVGVHCQLAGLKRLLADDNFDGHPCLAIIEDKGLGMEDPPAITHME